MNTQDKALSFEAYINNSDWSRKLNQMEAQLKGLTNTANLEADKMNKAFMKLGTLVGAYFSFQALTGLGRQLISVRGEFEQLGVSFNTMLGSKEKADRLMAELTELAAKTPFSLTQVGDATKTLLAYGVASEDAAGTLRKLGDIASATGGQVEGLARLYGKVLSTGKIQGEVIEQFSTYGISIRDELAKIFKIDPKAVQELVSAGLVGFKEMNMIIDNLTSSTGRFYNMMESQSKTIPGMISNMGDAWDKMLNDIGKGGEGLIKGGIEVITKLIENYEKIIDIIKVVVAVYGAYRAALILTNMQKKYAAIATELAAKAEGKATVATVLQTAATRGLAAAWRQLNKVMVINPFTAIATVLALIVSSMAAFKKETVDVKDTMELAKEATEGIAEQMGELKGKVTPLINEMQNLNLSEKARLEAYNKLKEIYPDIIGNLSFEQAQVADLTIATEEYYEAQKKVIALKMYEDQLTEAGRALELARSQLDETKKLNQEKRDAINKELAGMSKLTQYTGNYQAAASARLWELDREENKAKEAFDKASKAWEDVEARHKGAAEAIDKSTDETTTAVVETVKTAASEIIELQNKIILIEKEIGTLAADATGDAARKRLATEKEIAEKRIKFLKGEAAKDKTAAGDITDRSKKEIETIRDSYSKLYEYVNIAGGKVDQGRMDAMMSKANAYTAFLNSSIDQLEARIREGVASQEDILKLIAYKEEQFRLTPQDNTALTAIQAEIETYKTAYQDFHQFIISDGARADEARFADLKARGLTFRDYVNGIISEIEQRIAQNKATAEDWEKLYAYRSEQQRLTTEAEPRDRAALDAFQAEIDTKKQAYDDFNAYLQTAGETAANIMYEDLLKKGNTFSDYISNEIAVLEAKLAQGKGTEDELNRLIAYRTTQRRTTGSQALVEDGTMARIKTELAQAQVMYSDYYAFINQLSDKTEKARYEKMIERGASFADYIDAMLLDLEGKIREGTAKAEDWEKFFLYKDERAKISQAPTAEDEIRRRLGDVERVSRKGRSDLQQIQAVIDEIDQLIADVRGKTTDAFKNLTPEQQEKTLADLAQQKLDQQKKQTEIEIETAYELSKEYMTIERQRVVITQKALEEIAALEGQGYYEQAEIRKKAFAEDLAAFDTHQREMQDEFAILGVDFGNASVAMVQQIISMIDQVDLSGLTKEKAAEVVGVMNDAKRQLSELRFFDFDTIKERKADIRNETDKVKRLQQQLELNDLINSKVAKGFSYAQETLGSISTQNEELQKQLDSLNDILGVSSQVAASMATGQWFGAVTSGVALISKWIAEFFPSGAQLEAERAQKAMDDLLDRLEKMNALLDNQQTRIDKAFGVDKINAFNDALGIVEDNLREILGLLDTSTSDLLSFSEGKIATLEKTLGRLDRNKNLTPERREELRKDLEQQLTFWTKFHDDLGKITLRASSGLREASIADIDKAIETNQNAIGLYTDFLIENGAALDENTRRQIEESLAAFEQNLDELIRLRKEKQEYLTGTTAEGIADSIASGFDQGLSSAKDFAENFEELMRGAIINSMKTQYLDKAIAGWMVNFTDAMESDATLSEEERERLRDQWTLIITQAKEQLELMSETAGMDWFGDSGLSSQLTGAIKGITEETASVIAGQMNAIRIQQYQALYAIDRLVDSNVETAENTRYIKNIYYHLLNNRSGNYTVGYSGQGIKF